MVGRPHALTRLRTVPPGPHGGSVRGDLLGALTVWALIVPECASYARIAGGVLLAIGLARLGFVTNLLAEPALYGFLFGMALTIVVRQAAKIAGVSGGDGEFLSRLWTVPRHVPDWSVILLTGAFLSPLFTALPEPVLGAIVIVAVRGFLSTDELRRYVAADRASMWVVLTALFGVLLFDLLPGLLLAVALSLVLFIARASTPHVVVLGRLPDNGRFGDLTPASGRDRRSRHARRPPRRRPVLRQRRPHPAGTALEALRHQDITLHLAHPRARPAATSNGTASPPGSPRAPCTPRSRKPRRPGPSPRRPSSRNENAMPTVRSVTRRRRISRATWPNRGLALTLAGGGALLGWWLPHAERSHHLGGLSYDPAAAQATLGAIAAGVITLTGFVLTAVTLVVQSVQSMSPRLVGVLGYFERALVLFGALTGTAVYALVVLAQVSDTHVPRLSVTLAIVFVVLSTGAILRSLAELREMVTGGGLVRAVALRLHTALDHAWPERQHPPSTTSAPPGPPTGPIEITATRSGIVQQIDSPAIVDAAARCDIHVVCLVAVGSFIEPGTPLLRVTPTRPSAAEARRLTRAVCLGPSRHIDHDPAYGLRILVDVAIRALSPAVNDPTTAVQALDQIESALLRIATHPLGTAVIHDHDGTPRLTIPRPNWTALLDLALAEITQYGADSLQIHRRLRALLDTLTRACPAPRIPALRTYRAILDRSAHALPHPAMTVSATIPDTQGLGGPDPYIGTTTAT